MRSRGRTRNENHQVSDVTRKVAVAGSLIRVQETPSAFHQLAQRIAFRDHDARQQSRSFASWNQYPGNPWSSLTSAPGRRRFSQNVDRRATDPKTDRDAQTRTETAQVRISLGRRFTGGGEQFCPCLVGRFDKSGHFECRAGLKRLDGRDGM